MREPSLTYFFNSSQSLFKQNEKVEGKGKAIRCAHQHIEYYTKLCKGKINPLNNISALKSTVY